MVEKSSDQTTGVRDEGSILEILRQSKIKFEERWKDEVGSVARLSDFVLIKTLGRGKFGRVVLAGYLRPPKPTIIAKEPLGQKRSKSDGAYVTIKIMSKAGIVKNHGMNYVFREKKVLTATRYPFLVGYLHHFQDLANLYLVLEYVAGGDLYTRLKRNRRFSEPQVNFYATQLVLSLEYLHVMGIVYRDMKPENLMLGLDGFLKLTDFGFAKKIDGGETSTMCGTPEYLAPELVRGENYSYSVDWWALGILLFELLNGFTPFRSTNLIETLRKIVRGQFEYPSPPLFADEAAVHFISQLLKVNPNERLTNAPLIRRHRYFAAVDWIALYEKRTPAPFKPIVRHTTDTRHFEDHGPVLIEHVEQDVYEEIFHDF